MEDKNIPEELYKGFFMVKSPSTFSVDCVYFAESQEEEYKKYIQQEFLPDGRNIIHSEIFEEPVNRKKVNNRKLELMINSFSLGRNE